MESHHQRSHHVVTLLAHGIALACATLASTSGSARAAMFFSETFQYSIGSNLAGQNGGTGFSSAWSGGNSTIVAGLSGTSSTAVQIGTQSQRPLSSAVSTSAETVYLTYLMQASSFTGGQFTGISLWNTNTEEMFLGIPFNTQKFGFDAHAGNGTADIKTVDFTPAVDTAYLVAIGFEQSATSGKVDVNMWATSNLAIDPNVLVAGTPNAFLDGVKSNFTFNNVRVAGNYAGSLKVAGIASSTSITEAANISVNAVPEPSTYVTALAGLACGAWHLRGRRRKMMRR